MLKAGAICGAIKEYWSQYAHLILKGDYCWKCWHISVVSAKKSPLGNGFNTIFRMVGFSSAQHAACHDREACVRGNWSFKCFLSSVVQQWLLAYKHSDVELVSFLLPNVKIK